MVTWVSRSGLITTTKTNPADVQTELLREAAHVQTAVLTKRHWSPYLGQNSQQEPDVGHHLSDPTCVAGDDGHNVRDEMCNSEEQWKTKEGRKSMKGRK